MRKANSTMIHSKHWIEKLGRISFLILTVCFLLSSQSLQAQNYNSSVKHPLAFDKDDNYITSTKTLKLETCAGTNIKYTDDDQNTIGLYHDDTARRDTFEICAQDPWHQVVVTFAKFDLATGDTLWAFQGDTATLNATGTGAILTPASGFAASSAYGGWIGSSCDPASNSTGCLTFIFETNGDRNKGTGWEAFITCDDNPIQLEEPDIKSVKLSCPAPADDQINWARGWIDFPYPTIKSACPIASIPSNFILIIKNAGGKVCYRSPVGGAVNPGAPVSPTALYGADFAIGIYTAEYKLAADTIKTTGPLVFSVQAPSLTCNDEINVPFGSACMIQLQPDDILENTCDTSAIMQYDITITFGSGKNRQELKTVFTDKGTSPMTGSGSVTYQDVTYPILTRDMIEEAGMSVCGGEAIITIERVFFEHYNDLEDYAHCTSGLQKDKCSTILKFSDFTAPIVQLTSDIDTIVACSELEVDQLINSYVIDNCDKDANVSFEVVFDETDGCYSTLGDPGSTKATVNFVASDVCGNTSNTSKSFVFLRPTKAIVPDIFVVPSSLQVQCDGSDLPEDQGKPGVKIGYIKNGIFITTDTMLLSDEKYVCGYILLKEVEEIPQTDCGRKQIYTWSAVDWCDSSSGSNILGTQFIEYTDTIAPQFIGVGLDPINVPLGHFECTYNANVFVAPPANDNCNAPTVRLDSIFRIEDGVKWGVPHTDWAKLDCDSFSLRWLAEDPCHTQFRMDTAYQIVVIQDVTKPSVVTTDELIVSVPNDWGAVINVKDIDEGSYDACGIANREIRRDDDPDGWAETVNIGCEDVGNDVRVHLRITDLKGNQNTAWMIVKAEDRIAAVCSDLDPVYLDCAEMHGGTDFAPGTDADNDGRFEDSEWVTLEGELLAKFQAQFGLFSCSDNLSCTKTVGTDNAEEEYQLISLECGQLEIRRRFRLKDSGIHAASGINNNNWAHQTIYVASKSNWKVTLPADVIGMCNDDITKVTAPIISSSGCDVIAWEVEDRTFNVPGDACLKIERTYHIINWCKYSPGDEQVNMARVQGTNSNVTEPRMVIANDSINSDLGYFTYVQILKIQDNEAPVVTVHNPEDPCINGVEFDALPYGEEDNSPGVAPFECDEMKTWTATAADCSSSESMTWIGRLFDENGNQMKEVNTNTLTYAVSNKEKYYAEFWAYDGCGNSGGALGDTIAFWDCKAPIAYLLNGVSLSLTTNGNVEFWATDVDRGSFDNCTNQEDLSFYILDPLSDTAQPTTYEEVITLPQVISYDCYRVGNQPITIYVVDAEGNYDFASTQINIQDNARICEGLLEPTELGLVAGSIITSEGETVEEVTIIVNNGMKTSTTDLEGTFQFSLNKGDDYTVTPENNNNPLNGVSTFDLVLINKHILGIDMLDSPYKYIAADVNNSGTITAYDMVQMRQLILNITTAFPNNNSWRFVDASFEFSDQPLADNFNEFTSIHNLDKDMMYNNFIAVKIGDVNESATPNSLTQASGRNSTETLLLNIEDKMVKAGETVQVPFIIEDLDKLQGYQFTMIFEDLELMTIEDGVATSDHFNTNLRKALTTSWNKTNQSITSTRLFTLNFIATASGQLSQMLELNSHITLKEAYDETGAIMDIALQYKANKADSGFELKQNSPNPFAGETSIGFTLPKGGAATLKVLDAQGKVLKSIDGNYPKGYNTINLNAKEFRTTGVLYYQLETANQVATKKMIIIE